MADEWTGSDFFSAVGFAGLQEFADNLKKIHGDLNGSTGRAALMAGAEVFRSAIEAATPTGKTQYEYTTKAGRKLIIKPKRTPGTAKAHVIIYQRKTGTYVSEGIPNLLVGHEKKHGYWMYWYEYGTNKQAAQPFMRAVYDSRWKAALDASAEVISQRLKNG
jgi:HK97 gp10 family phage protein